MKFLTFFRLVFFIMMVSLGSSSMALSKQEGPKALPPFRVGALFGTLNTPGQLAMRRGLETTVENLNRQAEQNATRPIQLLPFVAGEGPESISNQARQMKALIAKKPDLILVQPIENAALSLELLQANREKIPVIAFDQTIQGPGQLACLVTTDNYQAGFQCGEFMANRFKNQKTLNIILIEYSGLQSTIDRTNGFLAGLKEHNQPFRIDRSYEAVDKVSGKTAANWIRRQFPMPGSIDVIFTVNDAVGLATVEELLVGNRTDIALASIGGDPASLDNIRNNLLTVIDSVPFCWHLGANAMLAGSQLLSGGKKIPKTVLLPAFPATQETLEQFQGWYRDLPEPFTKPWESLTPQWQWKLETAEGEPVNWN